MRTIRFYIALWAAKLATLLLRLLGRKATYFGGKLAIKLCPDFLGRIGKPETIVGVTGTNGKTTVNNLISDALAALGVDVLSNRYGSNINAGIASALLANANLAGKTRKKLAVLELDERSARLIYPYIRPNLLLCTNLFRDSMRRNAHSEYILDVLTRYIPADTRLILNADDPVSAFLAPQCTQRVYFGIDPQDWEPPARENIVRDARLCPNCGAPLDYTFRRYNHIGRVRCAACGLTSPEPDYRAVGVDLSTMRMTVHHGAEPDAEYKLAGDAMYNVYNTLAALTVLRELGYSAEDAQRALGTIEIVRSRYWSERIGGQNLTVIMAKGLNAVACSRSFDYVSAAEGEKRVVLMLDDVFDQKNSSENVAWLYDADFEFLADPSIRQIVTVGVRCLDSRLRLLIAGVAPEKILAVDREEDAAAALELDGTSDVYVLYELYREPAARRVRGQIAERMREAL